MILELTEDLYKSPLFDKLSFDAMMNLSGKCYRELEGRRTHKIELKNKNYFIKQHFGVGWREIFKNLLQLRFPIVSARNEWQALLKLKQLNVSVPTVAGFGYKGFNPAKIQSFILTEELPKSVSLEDFCKDWLRNPPAFQLKQMLLKEVARITRTMHINGINHRDLYICHFLYEGGNNLHLIDLHRAQMRKITPARWKIKDLAGLYFSSKDIGLTRRDLFRFMKYYQQQRLRNVILKEENFWLKVKKRGDKLYKQHR